MTDCIFCKIVNGEVPAKKIYEDEKTIAFLSIEPLTFGHTLVIPKEHYEDIFDMPEELLKEVFVSVKKVSEILKEKLKCDGINVMNSNGKVAQQDVFHYHVHVVPRYAGSNFKLKYENSSPGNIDEVFQKIKE